MLVMRTFGDAFLQWLETLRFPAPLPDGVEVLDPYREPAVRDVVAAFARRYYDDTAPRIGIFGINPGRFGAGTTGLSFTDPYALAKLCGIPHSLGNGRELSATFVYETIAAFGGVERFYRCFYMSALVPLGLVRGGRNLNFYDDPRVERVAVPFIVETLWQQIAFPLHRQVAIVLGSGKLRRIAEQLNAEHRFFERLIVLEHPRFVMQYRRRRLAEYVERYVRAYHDALTLCGSPS
jgi:hypothetical protein